MAATMAWFLLTCVVAVFGTSQGIKTVKVTTIAIEPYLMVNDTDSSSYYGMIVDVLDAIERVAEVRFQLALVPDSRFGSLIGGTWNGMIGQIVNEKADLVAAPLVVTLKRERYIDFTVPFQSRDAMIVLNKERPRHGPPITCLGDLVNQGALQYGTVRGSALAANMNSSGDEDVQAVVQAMYAHPKWMKSSNTDGVYAVRRNVNYAFLMEGAMASYIARRPPCDLDVVATGFAGRQYAFAVRNYSPLRDVINEALTKLGDDGELARIERKWWSDECSGAVRSSGSAVLAVIVMLVGVLLSR